MAMAVVSLSHPMSAGASSGLVHAPNSTLVETKRTCGRIAASDATVLLTGETGTGKEVFARFVHSSSPRNGKAFVPVNCGAIPETLLESELFGFVKGAFTGAVAARRGRVSMAEGGTLFLDEIGELPLSLQVKLLRLLQERTFEPIGSSESLNANFRLIAATNRDLGEEVKAGRFRSDLYYRLHVCPIRLPALRERRGDIAHLFAHFWARRGETRAIEPAVMQCLENYAWPGNVRELENLVERVSVCAEGDIIRLADLPMGVRAPHLESVAEIDILRDRFDVPASAAPASPLAAAVPMSISSAPGPVLPTTSDIAPRSLESIAAELRVAGRMPPIGDVGIGVDADDDGSDDTRPLVIASGETPTPTLNFPIDLPTMLRDLENAYINAALAQTGSNKKEAARLLGMGRTTLVEKLRRRNTDASRS
ncbi:MAG: sigma-54 dependent transcriptional regulator, flagellar regulatory protein [Myxococcales bacterium]|jgi:sigma-54 specific flagellar transcriptional regulator A|nr:sigma-54 dependent transcriptional regulator, flagellar regulatory protein [Myxococcales bacterium]